MRTSFLIGLGALLAASGCGSTTLTPTTAPTAPTPTATAPPVVDEPARGVAGTRQGDRATITIGLGEPRPARSVTDAAVQACRLDLEPFGGLDRAVAVPVTVTAQVTSSPPSDVTINLHDVSSLGDGGTVGFPNQLPLWGARYGDGPPQCQGPANAVSAGSVRFPASTAKRTWSAWLVLGGALTPEDPSGEGTAGTVVIHPLVLLGPSLAGFALEPGSSDDVVECSASDPAAGTVNYLAVSAAVALQHGCTATEDTTGEICMRAYPNGAERTVDGVLISNREASLEHVCEGFGRPEGVSGTRTLQCAVIAVLADVSPPGPAETVDRLCQTGEILAAFQSGAWLASAGELACGYFADFLAVGVGVLAAGASSSSGPGAIAIGRAAYAALSAGLGLACDGLFTGNLGTRLEAEHQADVAHDVVHDDLCLARHTDDSQFDAVPCPNF